ncbi:putative transporter C22E12.01 [Neofusicoccum parvum]|uniref:Transporter C22E12.01 n=2 Tax=Neofusicoccum parvum TaxID=310453 RepID=A0ACB5SEQ5_9PEZI|nr:putative triose-phosphate transporter protein [Neofusicoccum parvum UCRNP2]GME36130.1 putative transporter C22E12.01 [Neofusicoccum parvum]GME40639.1 putative transporter C22E12.01 [Neofusicoccum parvum]
MEGSSTNHSRRRSTSLIGTQGLGIGRSNSLRSQRGHRRAVSEHIPEQAEDKRELDPDRDSSSPSGYEDTDDEDVTDEEAALTGKDRRKRRKHRRRNTQLDARIAADVTISEEEEKVATAALLQSSLINVCLIGLWYLFSISISIYNKWMFAKSDDKNQNLNFPFPLFTTCLHMIVQFTLASSVLYFLPQFRPRHDSLSAHDGSSPQRQDTVDPNRPLMTKMFYLTRIGPCGAATGLDIGLGNMSLKFISLTFFTMCKSSVLGFVLIFAFLFRLEKPSWKLGAIILTMTVGVIMMVAGETAFNALGFILIMSSALSSGFRWSLTQILLLRNPATSNPFSSIFFLAPVMFISLLVIAVPVEGFVELYDGFNKLREVKGTLLSILILVFPGTLAFLMTASEFALLKRTSVVTLSVCGIFKEIVTITAASVVFDDRLTTINLSGLIVTIGSIGAYNWMKFKRMREEARMEAHLQKEDYQPVLTAEPPEDERPVRDQDRLLVNDIPPRQSPVKRPEDLD